MLRLVDLAPDRHHGVMHSLATRKRDPNLQAQALDTLAPPWQLLSLWLEI